MAGKFESQFKHRDERILKIAPPRDPTDSETPVFDGKDRERQIRFTVAFVETITIAATAYESRRRIVFSELVFTTGEWVEAPYKGANEASRLKGPRLEISCSQKRGRRRAIQDQISRWTGRQ